MADTPKLSEQEAKKLAKLALDEIALMGPHSVNLVREGCVDNLIPEEKAATEEKFGKGSFPEVHEYCLAGINRAIKTDVGMGLYANLTMQQLGLGREFIESEGDAAVIGDKHIRLARNIRGAAEAGLTEYVGANGKTYPLTCAMALDNGAAWAAANPDRVDRPDYSDGQLARMTRACYNPDLTGNVTIAETGETMPVQRMGLIAGELLGRRYQLEIDTASTTGAVDGVNILPETGPIPPATPERPGKQAKVLGN